MIVVICFLTALSRVPFQYFFEAVSIQAFVSAAMGAPLAEAILTRILKVTMAQNTMLLGSGLDHVNPATYFLSSGELLGAVGQQALMVSMKEIFGRLIFINLGCLLFFMLKESTVHTRRELHPRYRVIRRYIKHELLERHLWKKIA